MTEFKRSCLTGLATGAICSGAYWYFLRERIPPPFDWIASLIAGFLMALAVGMLRNAIASARDAISFSSEPVFTGMIAEKPKDRQLVAVTGRIRALNAPLQAPFSGRSAVLYKYEIDKDLLISEENSDFHGFAMTASVIDSSYGPLRILGFPILEGFKRERQDVSSEEALANARTFIEKTDFIDEKSAGLSESLRQLLETLEDADGRVHQDFRRKPYGYDVKGKKIAETIVAPSEQVCVVGRYSAQKNGLVPDVAGNELLRLIRGDKGISAGALTRKTLAALARVIVIAAFVNGGLYLLLRLLPR
ncbi:MAG: hypothetical protein M3041_08615 [Acidobacteriota bacterium]|nr:hypothetical protein [Acidobacteriota bacterium]